MSPTLFRSENPVSSSLHVRKERIDVVLASICSYRRPRPTGLRQDFLLSYNVSNPLPPEIAVKLPLVQSHRVLRLLCDLHFFHRCCSTMGGITSCSLRHRQSAVGCQPFRSRAARITGKTVPSIFFGFPPNPPASTSHQFQRVSFPFFAHREHTLSIFAATSGYLFSTSQSRAEICVVLISVFVENSFGFASFSHSINCHFEVFVGKLNSCESPCSDARNTSRGAGNPPWRRCALGSSR